MSTAPGAGALLALAARHGLDLDPASLRIEEAGLDFRVVLADGTDGRRWVLRIPRRPDAAARAAEERRVLAHLRPRLPVRVPDWQVVSPELIAYPLLPGRPGLTLDAAGQPVWHLDPASPVHARSLGELVAALHGLDPAEAAAAGVPARTPEQLRRQWAEDLERVLAEFAVAPALTARWRAWLDDDGLWPRTAVVTHGELYPAHTLHDEQGRILGVLDWTTAAVGDPAVDLMYQHLVAPPEAFTATVRRYEEHSGRHEPRLAERCAALQATGPLAYALFALRTGEAGHRATAAAQLDP